jgi:hypothetical protein
LSEEDNEAGKLHQGEEVVGVIFPADEDATLPLYPGEKSARPASVACNGLAAADLAWPAYGGWNDAARSSQCRRFATPHPADRCHRRDQVQRAPFPADVLEPAAYVPDVHRQYIPFFTSICRTSMRLTQYNGAQNDATSASSASPKPPFIIAIASSRES